MTREAASLLRELREKRSVSLRQAARELDVDPAYLSRIERGDSPPSARVVARLASYYMRSADEVLLAAGRIPEDVIEILRKNPFLVEELRQRYGAGGSA